MTEVTVVANLPVLGLRKGQKVTVELTDLIQGALDGGKLSRVTPDGVAAGEPATAEGSHTGGDADDKRKGGRRGERPDHDAPGGDS